MFRIGGDFSFFLFFLGVVLTRINLFQVVDKELKAGFLFIKLRVGPLRLAVHFGVHAASPARECTCDLLNRHGGSLNLLSPLLCSKFLFYAVIASAPIAVHSSPNERRRASWTSR